MKATSSLLPAALLAVLLFPHCVKDEVVLTGSVEITVISPLGPVTGATVTATQATSAVPPQTTDANGVARFRDIPTGEYVFEAEDPVFGTMSITLTLRDHPVGMGEINLLEGAVPPGIELRGPSALFPAIIIFGDSLPLSYFISDPDQPVGLDWSLEIRSDLDGVVYLGPTSFQASGRLLGGLSLGSHELTFTVTDVTRLTATAVGLVDIVPKPDAPRLVLAEAGLEGTLLRWESVDSTQFQYYILKRIYEDTGEEQNIGFLRFSEREFFDSEAVLGRTAKYQVIKKLDGGDLVSNELIGEFQYPVIPLNTRLTALVADPARPYLYALDGRNNRLLFIDLNSMSVVSSIGLGGTPVYFYLNAAADRLYVLTDGRRTVEVFNVATRTLARTFDLDLPADELPDFSSGLVEIGGENLVYYQDKPAGRLRSFNGSGVRVVGDVPSGRYPTAAYDAINGHLYLAGGEPSNGQLQRFTAADGQLMEDENITNTPHSFNYYLLISSDGNCVFHGDRKRLTTNLRTIAGDFNDRLLAISDDGQLAAGYSGIYSVSDFSQVRRIPDGLLLGAFPQASRRFYGYFQTGNHLVVMEN
jgi:hypothetical protein